MNRRGNMFLGLIFIVTGLLFLMNNLGVMRIHFDIFDIGYIISRYWPSLFLILPGIAMHSAFFFGRNRDAGILVPAGILLTTGIIFQLARSFRIMHLLWPGLILAVAIGLFELYLFGTRDRGLLIPVTILSATSAIFFMSVSLRPLFRINIGQVFVPVILIACGVSIILKYRGYQ